MALHAPRFGRHRSLCTHLQSRRQEAGACGNGTRCVAWALLRDDEERDRSGRDARGVFACRREGEVRFSVEMGRPRFGWQDIPLARAVADTARDPSFLSAAGGRRCCAVRGQYRQSARRLLRRRSRGLRSRGRSAPRSSTTRSFPNGRIFRFARVRIAPYRRAQSGSAARA